MAGISSSCRAPHPSAARPPPAPEEDRHGPTSGCRACETRPAVPCDVRSRGNQRHTRWLLLSHQGTARNLRPKVSSVRTNLHCSLTSLCYDRVQDRR